MTVFLIFLYRKLLYSKRGTIKLMLIQLHFYMCIYPKENVAHNRLPSKLTDACLSLKEILTSWSNKYTSFPPYSSTQKFLYPIIFMVSVYFFLQCLFDFLKSQCCCRLSGTYRLGLLPTEAGYFSIMGSKLYCILTLQLIRQTLNSAFV